MACRTASGPVLHFEPGKWLFAKDLILSRTCLIVDVSVVKVLKEGVKM